MTSKLSVNKAPKSRSAYQSIKRVNDTNLQNEETGKLYQVSFNDLGEFEDLMELFGNKEEIL